MATRARVGIGLRASDDEAGLPWTDGDFAAETARAKDKYCRARTKHESNDKDGH